MTTLRTSISRKTLHSPENSRFPRWESGQGIRVTVSYHSLKLQFQGHRAARVSNLPFFFVCFVHPFIRQVVILKKYLILLFFKSQVGTCASLSLSPGRQKWEGDKEVTGSNSPVPAGRASLITG